MSIDTFEQADARDWQEAFYDSGTDDWQAKWFCDGELATIENTSEGMNFYAGTTGGYNEAHAVLWTRPEFQGDLRIEYEYTRLDEFYRHVTILYLHATGMGEGPYVEDIAEWAERRKVPAMRMYFDYMNLLHISYAAYGNQDDRPDDYIRARRYIPKGDASNDSGNGATGLANTDLEPDYFNTGLWQPDVPHRITVIKRPEDLFMRIIHPEKQYDCHWRTNSAPPVTHGRIGLRHMNNRHARYRDFRISVAG